ncbi:DUF6653 family protein [Oricola cellulosilytica]|uniref:Uncharacterized protein n=1 Tax=Oricola cellulosilytica TaxID=1429082 RepID=A0A4R0PB02_9HYPH|nr:DUF6653 family protein [Oricola cellulosilytica]TCD14421.1 hypothetical protein E0D97_10165 [Oricola cellulosilytica]
MRLDKSLERSMAMSDATWARHANPWSVWTRFPVLPLLALAIWSRVWIGWLSLVPIVLLVLWTFYNPRAFPPPASTDNWVSKGTFGERVWLNRKTIPIPAHHAAWARWLSVASGLSLLPMIWGLYALDPWAAALGALLASVFKIWFVDRMVWLYEDMKDADPVYAGWLVSKPERRTARS